MTNVKLIDVSTLSESRLKNASDEKESIMTDREMKKTQNKFDKIYVSLLFEIKECSGRSGISQETLIRILNTKRDKTKMIYDDLTTVEGNEAQGVIDQALIVKTLSENEQLRVAKREF